MVTVLRALRNVAVLAGLTGIAGAAIAWFVATTADDVRRNRLEAETRVLRELSGIDLVTDVEGDLLRCEQDLVVLRGSGRGYGGEFRLAVAVQGGAVQGVRIIEHAETPGFGDILNAGSAWLESFRDDEAHAVTGATVTSQSVMAAVERTVARLHREGLCAP